MLAQGIDSRMHVASQATQDPTISHGNMQTFRRASFLDRQIWRLQRSPVKTWRSPARFASTTAAQINRSSADIVHLHWITDGFLSVEEIGKIDKPIVWSMYDMWPFTGTEHYGVDRSDARWKIGYTKANRPSDESGFDLDRWTYERKARAWRTIKQSAVMVPASTWLTEATTSSALMHNWRTQRIPHVVDTDFFHPVPQHEARAALGLKQNERLLLFLASAGIGDQRKGWDLLARATPAIQERVPNCRVVVVGPKPELLEQQGAERASALPIHWFGIAETSQDLKLLYNAADVTVVPSREDNMPLTAMEAQSCGCPVVGFTVGGMPDIVTHGASGFLAQPGDTDQLAQHITNALAPEMRTAARAHALKTWSPQVVVPSFNALYRELQT